MVHQEPSSSNGSLVAFSIQLLAFVPSVLAIDAVSTAIAPAAADAVSCCNDCSAREKTADDRCDHGILLKFKFRLYKRIHRYMDALILSLF